jgi:hypothetical protein
VRRLREGGHLVEHYRSQGSLDLTTLTYPRVVLVVGPQVTTVGKAGMQFPRSSGRYTLLNKTGADVVWPARRTMVHMRQVQGLVGDQDAVVGRGAQQLERHEQGLPAVELVDPAVGGAARGASGQHDVAAVLDRQAPGPATDSFTGSR